MSDWCRLLPPVALGLLLCPLDSLAQDPATSPGRVVIALRLAPGDTIYVP